MFEKIRSRLSLKSPFLAFVSLIAAITMSYYIRTHKKETNEHERCICTCKDHKDRSNLFRPK